ncbi:hypothetical protein F9278_10185 [Streptomyces phaeolivaceus]|uniref:Uncharacterized protein n=1 Tax=Streptomyces phaeolivaceus TaxID=2653200 RepID=A0A5P8K0L4_9ACTN|nr:hypothetical protein [Streptomyces phaeolivaceus]QFQ96520.1 hypothetical protein F9278_10185 [Streptomyces phaeolivaceus]
MLVGDYNFGATPDSCARIAPRERERRAVAAGVGIHGAKYRTEPASSFSHHRRRTPHVEAARNSVPGGPDHRRHKPLAVTALHARVERACGGRDGRGPYS